MKQLIVFALLIVPILSFAQKDSAYQFESLIDLPTTAVKDQHRSGTCWSFSMNSFIETEVLREGGKELDLSEMFVVRHCYAKKAEKYVRMHGEINFGAGGAFHDNWWVLENYGLVPESAYAGIEYKEEKHTHGELDLLLKSMVDAVKTNKNKKLSPVWLNAYNGVLDAYLGTLPQTFEYEGKEYTAKSFAKEFVPLDPSDYVSLTSYTHHPFYSSFILEIPDNWLWKSSYNLPLDELMSVFYNALNKGYSVAWGGDVSDKGFSYRKGIAVLPETELKNLEGTEQAKWEDSDEKKFAKDAYAFKKPVPEKVITQALRQEGFDNYSTTDDHGMHITGLLKDVNGTKYFKVKNSWDTENPYKGYVYMSDAYARLRTMNIVVHKKALPKKLRKKLGL